MPLRRSASLSDYANYKDNFHHISSPNPYHLRRILSESRIEGSKESSFIGYNYRSSTPYPPTKYNQAWDVYKGDWYDRRYYTSPVYWPYPTWRYRYLDPPQSLYQNYPNLSWYPKTNRDAFFDMVSPNYLRGQSDPYYSKPLYSPYRPWVYEKQDIGRAVKLHEMNLISRNTLEKYWLMPRSFESRWNDYTPPYRPATWYTSPRRYYFSYPYC